VTKRSTKEKAPKRAAKKSARHAGSARERRNIAQGYIDDQGRFRPIRAAKDYNEFLGKDFEPRPSRRKPVEQMRLSEFVRHSKGMRAGRSADYLGELKRLSKKESGTTGLFRKAGGFTVEQMAQHARDLGFRVSRDPQKFIAQVEGDLRGYHKISHPEKEIANPDKIATLKRLREIDNPAAQHAFDFDRAAARGFHFPKSGAQVVQLQRVESVDLDRSGRRLKGTVIGRAGEYLKVKWDGYSRAHLVMPHLLTKVNPVIFRKVKNVWVTTYKGARPNPARGDLSLAALVKQWRPNPDTATMPARLHEIHRTFHGQEASSTYKVRGSRHIPQKFDELGKLIRIEVGGEIHDNLPKAAALVVDERGDIQIVGLKFHAPKVKEAGEIVRVAPIDRVVYETDKQHIREPGTHKFNHKMSEHSGAAHRPVLCLDNEGWPMIDSRDAHYKVAAPGIID
jgi:hypothetical protein